MESQISDITLLILQHPAHLLTLLSTTLPHMHTGQRRLIHKQWHITGVRCQRTWMGEGKEVGMGGLCKEASLHDRAGVECCKPPSKQFEIGKFLYNDNRTSVQLHPAKMFTSGLKVQHSGTTSYWQALLEPLPIFFGSYKRHVVRPMRRWPNLFDTPCRSCCPCTRCRCSSHPWHKCC